MVLTHSLIFDTIAETICGSDLFFLLAKITLQSYREILNIDASDMAFDFLNLEYVTLKYNAQKNKKDISLKIRPFKCYKLMSNLSPKSIDKSVTFTRKTSCRSFQSKNIANDIWNLKAFKSKNRLDNKAVALVENLKTLKF